MKDWPAERGKLVGLGKTLASSFLCEAMDRQHHASELEDRQIGFLDPRGFGVAPD
jgi:hypothetical protein